VQAGKVHAIHQVAEPPKHTSLASISSAVKPGSPVDPSRLRRRVATGADAWRTRVDDTRKAKHEPVLEWLNGRHVGVGLLTPPQRDELLDSKIDGYAAFYDDKDSTPEMPTRVMRFLFVRVRHHPDLVLQYQSDCPVRGLGRPEVFLEARLHVEPNYGVVQQSVEKSALITVLNELGNATQLTRDEIRIVERSEHVFTTSPYEPAVIDGMNTKCTFHYVDAYVTGLPDMFTTRNEIEEQGATRHWQWVPWYDAPMQVHLPATATFRQLLLELHALTGSVWLTCEHVSRICASILRSFTNTSWAGAHGVVEDVAVSLFSRVVDVQNWKDVLLALDHSSTKVLSRRLGWLNMVDPTTLEVDTPDDPESKRPRKAFYNFNKTWTDTNDVRCVDPTRVNNLRFELDLTFYDDWIMARILSRMMFQDDNSFRNALYSTASSKRMRDDLVKRGEAPAKNPRGYKPGWLGPEPTWNEFEVVENAEMGLPEEGELEIEIFTRPQDRNVEARQELKDALFLSGIARPLKSLYEMESDLHMYVPCQHRHRFRRAV
jgi:hypothetical protein